MTSSLWIAFNSPLSIVIRMLKYPTSKYYVSKPRFSNYSAGKGGSNKTRLRELSPRLWPSLPSGTKTFFYIFKNI